MMSVHGKRLALLCAVLAGLFVFGCRPAQAQSYEMGKGYRASLGMFYITDGDARDVVGTGIGAIVEKTIREDERGQLSASIGYIRHANTYQGSSVHLSTVPLMVTMRFGPRDRGTKPYFAAGVGFVHTSMDVSDEGSASETDFGYQLVGGMKLGAGEKLFVEARYLTGSRTGNTGVLLSVGGTF